MLLCLNGGMHSEPGEKQISARCVTLIIRLLGRRAPHTCSGRELPKAGVDFSVQAHMFIAHL